MVSGCEAPADTVDHVIPLVEGGPMYEASNLRAACARHNYSSGAALSTARDLGSSSREWLG